MGIDGHQRLTIHGPRADIDALEAAMTVHKSLEYGTRGCGAHCALVCEKDSLVIPPLEVYDANSGEQLLDTFDSRIRYRWFATEVEYVKRHDSQTLLVFHTYRNIPEYSFLFLLAAKYKACTFINFITSEMDYCERLVICSTDRGTLHVQAGQIEDLGEWFPCKKGEFSDRYKARTSISTLRLPMDTSMVHYKLTFTEQEPTFTFADLGKGDYPVTTRAAEMFAARGIKMIEQKGGWYSWRSVEFDTKGVKPDALINLLWKLYPECHIDGRCWDHNGVLTEIDGIHYSFIQFQEIPGRAPILTWPPPRSYQTSKESACFDL